MSDRKKLELNADDIKSIILDLKKGKEEASKYLANTTASRDWVASFSASFNFYTEMINAAKKVIAEYTEDIKQWQLKLADLEKQEGRDGQ